MPSLNSMAKDAKKKKTDAPKKPTKTVSLPPNLSTEFIQDSDLEEDEKADESSTSDEEESLPDKPVLAVPKANGKITTSSRNSSSSSGSESESAEESEDEDEDEEESDVPEHGSEVTKSAKPISTPKTASSKAFPYQPPTGFELASANGTSTASQLFEKPNLEGRQLWYITAPATFPISSIKEVSLENIQSDNAIISHNNNKYSLVQDSSEDVNYTKVMTPTAGNQYRTASRPIDRTLKVKEIVQLPSATIFKTKASYSARRQPPGLKMRFYPIGVESGKLGHMGSPSPPPSSGQGTIGISDEEMEEAPGRFRRPASIEQDSSTSSEEEVSSNSDAEMADPPPSKPEPAMKSRAQKSTAEGPSKTASPLKRKRSEKGELAVNSSSNAKISTDTQLNSIKKKQRSSPAGSQSVSTETQNTLSKLPRSPKISTSHVPPPKSMQNRSSPISSLDRSSYIKSAPIRPPSPSPMSLPQRSHTSGIHSMPRQPSEQQSKSSPTKNHVSVTDIEEKKRKKEAKRQKKENLKLDSITAIGESAVSLDVVANSSIQAQDRFNKDFKEGEKNKATDEKKKRRKEKVDKPERAQNPVPSANKSSPILPPKRSVSTILAPNGTSER